MTLLNYYYYLLDWAGKQSLPHTPFMTDPPPSILCWHREAKLRTKTIPSVEEPELGSMHKIPKTTFIIYYVLLEKTCICLERQQLSAETVHE